MTNHTAHNTLHLQVMCVVFGVMVDSLKREKLKMVLGVLICRR